MRFFKIASFVAALTLVACGQSGAPAGGDSGAPAQLSEAERAQILELFNLSADAQGQVVNECGEAVTPRFLAADMGGEVGDATLFVMDGGPNAAACYGDGSDLHLMMRDGPTWREIYSARGRVLVIMPTSTNGVHDIADGGPGSEFPLWQWNGTEYAHEQRTVTDSEAGEGEMLP